MKKLRYNTSWAIKKQLWDLAEWVDKNPNTGKTPEELVDAYLEEKDIAYSGELRKIQFVSSRNPLKEIGFAIGVTLAEIGIAILIASLIFK